MNLTDLKILVGLSILFGIISCSKNDNEVNNSNADTNTQDLLSVTVSENKKTLTYTNIYNNNGQINAVIGDETDNASINYNSKNISSVTNNGNSDKKGTITLSDLNGDFGFLIKTFIRNGSIIQRDGNNNPIELSYYDEDKKENLSVKVTYDTKHPFVFYSMIVKNYGLDSLLSNYRFSLFSTTSLAKDLIPVNNITNIIVSSPKRGIMYISQLTYDYNETTKYPITSIMTRINYDYNASQSEYKNVSIFSFKYK